MRATERLWDGRRILVGALVLVMLGLAIGGIKTYQESLPAWQLTAKPSPEGVQVEIYKEGESIPTYSTILEGHSIPNEVRRIKQDVLPEGVGRTTFSDETLRPGRWTLEIDGVELDIMPARLVIDGRTELAPRK